MLCYFPRCFILYMLLKFCPQQASSVIKFPGKVIDVSILLSRGCKLLLYEYILQLFNWFFLGEEREVESSVFLCEWSSL